MIPGKARENAYGRMPSTKKDEGRVKSADSSKGFQFCVHFASVLNHKISFVVDS